MTTKVEFVIPALDKLAERLGTTSEYLWGVLLKQAPIYAATTMLEVLLIAVVVYFYIKFFKRVHDWFEDPVASGVTLTFASIFMVGLVLAAFMSISGIIVALLNPEYWALKQVLSALKIK